MSIKDKVQDLELKLRNEKKTTEFLRRKMSKQDEHINALNLHIRRLKETINLHCEVD